MQGFICNAVSSLCGIAPFIQEKDLNYFSTTVFQCGLLLFMSDCVLEKKLEKMLKKKNKNMLYEKF